MSEEQNLSTAPSRGLILWLIYIALLTLSEAFSTWFAIHTSAEACQRLPRTSLKLTYAGIQGDAGEENDAKSSPAGKVSWPMMTFILLGEILSRLSCLPSFYQAKSYDRSLM